MSDWKDGLHTADVMAVLIAAEKTGIPAATLASLRPGPNGEPATHVVVPWEPTEAILAACREAAQIEVTEWPDTGADGCLSDDAPADIWAAMLAAAQAPGHD